MAAGGCSLTPAACSEPRFQTLLRQGSGRSGRGKQPGRCNNGNPTTRLRSISPKRLKPGSSTAAGGCNLAPAAVFLCCNEQARLSTFSR